MVRYHAGIIRISIANLQSTIYNLSMSWGRNSFIARVSHTSLPKFGGFDTSRNSVLDQWRDLFRYRELIKLLTIKDVKLRYKDSFLGFLWSLINPLLMMLVFYIVFAVLLRTPTTTGCSEVVPAGATDAQRQAALDCRIYGHYPVFILIGILAWNFTNGSIMAGMHALLGNSHIIKKVYFPREVLPIAAVMAQLVNFVLALIPLAAVMLFSGVTPTGYVILLPVILFFHMLFLVGLAMIVSMIVLSFRDLGVIMEVLLQAWFFLSPVIYSMEQIFKEGKQLVYWLNPMASFIETYRTLLFFDYSPDLGFTIRTCMYGVITFGLGYAFFIWKRKKIGELL